MTFEQVLVVAGAVGFFPAFGWSVRYWINRRDARRREIYEPLADFAELVQHTAGRDWPRADLAAWGSRMNEVQEAMDAVRRSMNHGRSAAGRPWCGKIEALLADGWRLVAHCYSMGQGLDPKENDTEVLLNRTEGFNDAYRRLL